MSHKILIVDDEESICFTLKRFLTDEGYQVSVAYSYQEALTVIDNQIFDIIFADIVLKQFSGTDLLRVVKESNSNCQVIMITGVPSIETASEAVRFGAFDYLPKPVLQKDLLEVTRRALPYKLSLDEMDLRNQYLEATFKGSDDAIITVDKNLMILMVNQRAQEHLMVDGKKVKGMALQTFFTNDGKACIEVVNEAIVKEEYVQKERIQCTFGKRTLEAHTLCAYPVFNDDNHVSGGVLIIRTDRQSTSSTQTIGSEQMRHSMIGGASMQSIFLMIENLCDIRTTVLLNGETGTGKELVAEALHNSGAFHDKPLIKVNCATVSENLLESELFGHVKGAFSGAIKDKIGKFEAADGGSIFLDEIGDITPKMQLALLRVIQEKELEKVGDIKPVKIDVRIVAATNKDLIQEVAEGRFRQDLYYRLKVVQINLPPLRDRKEDIPRLVTHFIDQLNQTLNTTINGVSPDILTHFMDYDWPGNVRELKNIMEYASIVSRDQLISIEHMPNDFSTGFHQDPFEKERSRIVHVLERNKWNKTSAAFELGISRQRLYRKMKKYQIEQ
ncbi:MAG: sigma-54-dependent Fis family transcriptional regulator [Deltaproteobacteria bacterium]|jgi:two-component system, NtrC family, response regulator HydG|nr:sigma-54-dependent Fis family transcriptional regulator [Deltaproteobacteria bacterium]